MTVDRRWFTSCALTAAVLTGWSCVTQTEQPSVSVAQFRVDLDDISVYYAEAGSGEPILISSRRVWLIGCVEALL